MLDNANKNRVCDGLQPVPGQFTMVRGPPEYDQFISKEVLAQLN